MAEANTHNGPSHNGNGRGPAKAEAVSAPPKHGGALRRFWAGLWALLRQRCPRCRVGRMFRGSITMNDPCPVCGLLFQREEGYFLGALYVSYALSSILLIAFYVAAYNLLPGWDSIPLALLAVVLYL